MTKRIFEINHDRYAYKIDGQGEVIVMLHGFTSSQQTWDSIYNQLISDYQVLTIDLPGHGETKVAKSKTMKAFSEDFKALLDYLQLNKIHLLGYSMGGRTALSFANYYPEMISSLILESASPGIAEENARLKRQKADKLLAEKILEEGIESFVNDWEALPLFETQKNLPQDIQDEIRSERLNQTKEGLSMSLVSMGTGTQKSWWESLSKASYPVTLIVGEADLKFIKTNKEMNELYKDAKLYTIKEAGHCIHLERETEFMKVIQTHMNQMK